VRWGAHAYDYPPRILYVIWPLNTDAPVTYADIILPLPLPKLFTYSVPPGTEVQIGSRVIVPFGPRKFYTGIVAAVSSKPNLHDRPREIAELLDADPVVWPHQIEFFNWMGRYYLCTTGEVMQAALPAGLKITSETFISLNPEEEWLSTDVNEKQETLLHHLAEKEISVKEVSDLLELKHPQGLIKSLAEKRIVSLYEKTRDKYTPRVVRKIRLHEEFLSESALERLFAELEKKTKQTDVLLTYLRDVPVLENPERNKSGMLKSELVAQTSSAVNTLIKNGVLVEWSQVVSRLPEIELKEPEIPKLSPIQQLAFDEINRNFSEHNTVVLRGITGSGKTEIYISLIQQQLDQGKQVLLLLPEIALTTQIINRLQRVFGNRFGVYHSHYSDNERVEVWQKVMRREYDFIVGVRSSIFLPFSQLGLIIVDEEHEPSYKQFDPAPRYHARDAAIYLATLHGAKTLLGSATPALETFYQAISGKFGLVELDERFGEGLTPTVDLIDMRQVRKRKELRANIFSVQMLEAIGEALNNQEQIILFQNRRGYAPYVACDDCGHVIQCPNCDVSLTYHQLQNQLICHYCGYRIPPPGECPSCHLNHLKHQGFGTEQLEDELQPFFQEAKIQRMDLDTTRSKDSYQKILSDFESGRTQILIGTQMVSKGLDFDRVNLVGIFDIDRIIHFPDFRSHERAYQLITQVSGRAGRKSGNGRVLIQTYDPSHIVLQKVLQESYRAFYNNEITEREAFMYPPFYRLIKIQLKHNDVHVVRDASTYLGNVLRQHLTHDRITGPVDPVIHRIRNLYLKELTVKMERTGINFQSVKDFLILAKDQLLQVKPFRSVVVTWDVDPL
jgi:primosomal protein N' (replication factor Y)